MNICAKHDDISARRIVNAILFLVTSILETRFYNGGCTAGLRAVCSVTIPPCPSLKTERQRNPPFSRSDFSSSGGGNLLTELGRYLYAGRAVARNHVAQTRENVSEIESVKSAEDFPRRLRKFQDRGGATRLPARAEFRPCRAGSWQDCGNRTRTKPGRSSASATGSSSASASINSTRAPNAAALARARTSISGTKSEPIISSCRSALLAGTQTRGLRCRSIGRERTRMGIGKECPSKPWPCAERQSAVNIERKPNDSAGHIAARCGRTSPGRARPLRLHCVSPPDVCPPDVCRPDVYLEDRAAKRAS